MSSSVASQDRLPQNSSLSPSNLGVFAGVVKASSLFSRLRVFLAGLGSSSLLSLSTGAFLPLESCFFLGASSSLSSLDESAFFAGVFFAGVFFLGASSSLEELSAFFEGAFLAEVFFLGASSSLDELSAFFAGAFLAGVGFFLGASSSLELLSALAGFLAGVGFFLGA